MLTGVLTGVRESSAYQAVLPSSVSSGTGGSFIQWDPLDNSLGHLLICGLSVATKGG
jgi:hypothetical protein